MKSSKKLLLVVILFSAMIIFSCKKDNNSTSQTNTTPTAKALYQKRWNIFSAVSHRPASPSGVTGKSSFLRPPGNLMRRPAGQDTGYIAIEFLINSYIVFYSDNTVQVGQYTATNDTTLVLDSLGTIYITSLNTTTFSFTLIPLNGLGSVSVVATPANSIDSFSSLPDSEFISNTWKLDSSTINGVIDSTIFVSEDSISVTDTIRDIYAVFSAYGTYLVRSVYADGHEDYETNTWLWTNSNHNEFCYGNWDGQNAPDCNGLQSATISFSSTYNHLVIQGSDSSGNVEVDYLTKQ